MKIRKLPFWLVIALALAVGGLALAWALIDMRQVRSAPDVTFESYDGQHYRLAHLRGRSSSSTSGPVGARRAAPKRRFCSRHGLICEIAA